MVRELIYNAIAEALNYFDDSIYCSQVYELRPKSVPCAFIEQISKVRVREYADLNNTDHQHRLTFEVQVIGNSLSYAYEMMGVVEDTFQDLSFFEDMCEQIDNADITLSRIVARFSAQVDDDELISRLTESDQPSGATGLTGA